MALRTQRYEWIDFSKAVAIIGVILTHTYQIVYFDYTILLHTILSVDMFVFVGGITSAISINRLDEITPNYLLKRIRQLFVPYFFATLVNCLYWYKGTLSLTVFFTYLCNFSMPPTYFMAFYLQLILISTALFKIISVNYHKKLYILSILAAIYFFSLYLTKYSVVGMVGLAGGKVLGGTFFFVFALGMLFYMWLPKLSGLGVNAFLFLLSSSGLIFFEYKHYITRSWANPPVLLTIIYTLLVFGIVFSLYHILGKKIKRTPKIIQVFNLIGANSLYIFLYHLLFINLGIQYNITAYLKINNYTCYAIWILFCALVPPLLISFASKKYIRPYVRQLFFYRNNQRRAHNLF